MSSIQRVPLNLSNNAENYKYTAANGDLCRVEIPFLPKFALLNLAFLRKLGLLQTGILKPRAKRSPRSLCRYNFCAV